MNYCPKCGAKLRLLDLGNEDFRMLTGGPRKFAPCRGCIAEERDRLKLLVVDLARELEICGYDDGPHDDLRKRVDEATK